MSGFFAYALTVPNGGCYKRPPSTDLPVGTTQWLELRIEVFSLLNQFNWGNPLTNFNAGTFGRITTQAGAPRIIQFGIKYDF